jgi:PAS domain-containing protein
MGVPEEDLHGTGWGNTVHPQDIVVAGLRWTHSIDTGEPHEELFRLRSGADQRYYWLVSRAIAVRNGDSRISHRVGMNTRIDGIALAQEIGRVSMESNSLSHAVFDQLPVAMVVWSGVGLRVQRATSAARRYASLQAVEQQPLLAAYPELSMLCESGELTEVMLLGEGRRIANVSLTDRDGMAADFDVVCEPLSGLQGRVEGPTLAFLPA